MSIVQMKKLRLIALANERDKLLARLQHAGCLQVSEADARLSDGEWSALLSRDSGDSPRYKARLAQVRAALEALEKYAGLKSGLFIKRALVNEEAFFDSKQTEAALAVVDAINEDLRSISQLQSQENRLQAQKASLVPWASLDLPLDAERIAGGAVRLLHAVAPLATDIEAMSRDLLVSEYAAEQYLISSDTEQHYLLLLAHEDSVEGLQQVLRHNGLTAQRFKGLTGTAAENIAELEARLEQLDQEKHSLGQHIASYKEYRNELRQVLDVVEQEISKQLVRDRFLTDGVIVFLEGWVAETGRAGLERELAALDCCWELSEPEPEDEPPVLLKNSALVRPLNMVTEMYSLPAYRGIDPNPLIFIFYIFFFGMMFADIAYGLIIFFACLWLKKTYNPKGTLGYIAGLGMLCGVTTTICGVLTGGFFGDSLTVISESFTNGPVIELWNVISPLENPMAILYFGIGLGVVHMLFGQCVHIYMGFRDKRALDNILDVVPWWTFFAGCGLMFLQGASWLLIVGVAFLVLTQGRHKKGVFGKLFGGVASLYDITSWLGDVLSYARLMALMLASTVIASVVNILGALPGILVVFIPIFIIGHLFNIGINVIGTYVHAARLQYLEFFSKFYVDGGLPFEPLCYNTKYVDVINGHKEVV